MIIMINILITVGFVLQTLAQSISSSHHNVLLRTYPSADLTSLYSTLQTNQTTPQSLLHLLQHSTTFSHRSIDTLFSALPSMTELDAIILQADAYSILKTVQTLIHNHSIPCKQTIFYMLEMIGRIRATLQKKQLAVDQLTIITNHSETEINRIKSQIQTIQHQLQTSQLSQLYDKLNQLIHQLKPHYKQFNQITSQISSNEQTMIYLQSQISSFSSINDEQQNNINKQKIKVVENQAIIKNLQQKLEQAKANKSYSQRQIKKSQNIIQKNTHIIDDTRSALKKLQVKSSNLRDSLDLIKRQIGKFQIKIGRTKKNINSIQKKEESLTNQIKSFKAKLLQEENKLRHKQLLDLEFMVKGLIETLPSVSMEIDRQYYLCYGLGNIGSQTAAGVIVYVIRGESFPTYIENAYGDSIYINRFMVRPPDYMFYLIDIFNPLWTDTYGYPFSLKDFMAVDNSFENDFGCLNPSALKSGQGVIKQIKANVVTVISSNKKQMKLNLGACTRIQSTSKIVEAGQKIVYKGIPLSPTNYNTYAITCW